MKNLATLSVHSGQVNDQHGAVMPPIYATSTFAQPSPGSIPATNIPEAAILPAMRWKPPSP